MLYLDKLYNIYDILKSIGTNNIIFSDMGPIINNIKLSSCFDDDKCPDIICKKTNTSCSLIIPRINLIHKKNNEELYYTRLSDEFVRFNKFKNFIFENSNVYSYGSVEYNIINNELLLFQSSLTQEFFKDLPHTNKDNKYITIDTFDTLGFENTDKILNLENVKTEQKEKIVIDVSKAIDKDITKYLENPTKSKTIDEENEEDDLELSKNINLLTTYTDTNYTCSLHRIKITEGFSSNFRTTLYQLKYELNDKSDNNICSFQLILIIIKYHNKEFINLTIDQLKRELIDLYKKNNYFDSLCSMLLKKNKKVILEEVIKEKDPSKKLIKFEECVLRKEYYITYIDIYLISIKYDLPIILLCNTEIDKTITEEKFIIFNLSRNKNYFFIKHRSLYDRKKLHNHKLLININASVVTFNIDGDIIDSADYKLLTKIEYAINNYVDILGNYIANYDLDKKLIKLPTKSKKKKEGIQEGIQGTQTKKSKRCPKGTHKNKKSGLCDPI